MARKNNTIKPEVFEHLAKYYHFIICESAEMIERCHKVRHKVYCEEKGWEEQNAERLEIDQYEDSSVHVLIIDRANLIDVATFRLIIGKDLPLLHHESVKEDHIMHPAFFGDTRRCEISRFSILSKHRGKVLTTGMMLFCGYMCLKYKCYFMYAVMERALAIKTEVLGVKFRQISEPFFHNGQRAAYITTVLDGIAISCQDMSIETTRGVDNAFEAMMAPYIEATKVVQLSA